jgi:hypothetical protein
MTPRLANGTRVASTDYICCTSAPRGKTRRDIPCDTSGTVIDWARGKHVVAFDGYALPMIVDAETIRILP